MRCSLRADMRAFKKALEKNDKSIKRQIVKEKLYRHECIQGVD